MPVSSIRSRRPNCLVLGSGHFGVGAFASRPMARLDLLPEEGTGSTFQALLEVFGTHGLPLSLYTDRGSHYFHTGEAGGRVDRKHLTQVGRALAHLGVEHIAAYSPEARGRSERLFRTLQDRLVKELALAGIATVEAANHYIRTTYLPAHNARFAVKAEQEGSAFFVIPGRSSACRKSVKWPTTTRWRSTPCVCKFRPARCGRTSCMPRVKDADVAKEMDYIA
jgi:hypothetical protein